MQGNVMPYRAVITGGSRGIGRAIVEAIAPFCERIFVVGRDSMALEELRLQIVETEIVTLTGDVTDPRFVSEIRDSVSINGGLNLLINNAGITDFTHYCDQSFHDVHRMIEVNLVAPMRLTQSLLPYLTKEPAAQIINIGSSFGYIGYPGYAAYCATKFGLRGFTESLCRELDGLAVRVRLFSPRTTQTEANSPSARDLNQTVGNHADSAEKVASEFLKFLKDTALQKQLGFPESLFAWLNQVAPSLVAGGIRKQLPKIRKILASKSRV